MQCPREWMLKGTVRAQSLTYNVKCLCCHTVNSSAPQFTQVYFYPHCLVDLLRKLKKGPSPHQPNSIIMKSKLKQSLLIIYKKNNSKCHSTSLSVVTMHKRTVSLLPVSAVLSHFDPFENTPAMLLTTIPCLRNMKTTFLWLS